jgi:hypothetical protein
MLFRKRKRYASMASNGARVSAFYIEYQRIVVLGQAVGWLKIIGTL